MARKRKHDPAQVAQVSKWILTGASADDVAEAIRTTFPEADAAALMVAAMEEFRKSANFEPQLVRGWAFEATRTVYQRALEANDNAGALRAIKMLLEISKHVPDTDTEPDRE